MNWEHLKAIVWLRQRLFRNRLRRSGIANRVVTAILLCLGLLVSIAMFFVALVAGVKLLPQATPDQLLLAWTAVIGVFLFSWTIGLLTELQRSEVISLQKLLYFPVSLSGTFVVNYLSSFFSLTLIAFLPAMVGLCIASVVALGPYLLITFPLLAALILMVTAVTYHFRGWLAALMANKRRARTVVTLITMTIIILVQLPSLLNRYFLGSQPGRDVAALRPLEEEVNKLNHDLESGRINQEQARDRIAALETELHAKRNELTEVRQDDLTRWVRTIDLVAPPGWAAYGVMAAAQERVWPGLLGTLGLAAIGAVSLRRSYYTTLRFYRGEYESGGETKKKTTPSTLAAKRATNLVERDLPWIPEQAAATALATLRSQMRAPEVKMIVLSAVIVGGVFASTLLAGKRSHLPESLRPLMAMGVISLETLSLSQMFQNQFGFDRDGFRTLVLCPMRRRDILLGKNLALAPLALGIGALAIAAMQFITPQSATNFVASLIQLGSAFFIVCLVGNYTSIMLPNAVRSGALRSSTTTFSGSLLRLLAVFCLMVALVPLGIPLAIDLFVHGLNLGMGIPIYLILAAMELALLAMFYRLILASQGLLLQAREQKILEAVTAKND